MKATETLMVLLLLFLVVVAYNHAAPLILHIVISSVVFPFYCPFTAADLFQPNLFASDQMKKLHIGQTSGTTL